MHCLICLEDFDTSQTENAFIAHVEWNHSFEDKLNFALKNGILEELEKKGFRRTN